MAILVKREGRTPSLPPRSALELQRAALLAAEPFGPVEIATIKQAVAQRLKQTQYKHAATLYLCGRIKRHFQIESYSRLKRGQLTEALRVIELADGREVLPAPGSAPLPPAPATPAASAPAKLYHYPRERWTLTVYPEGVTLDPPSAKWMARQLWDLPLHQLLQELETDGHDRQGCIDEAGMLAYFA